MIICRDANTESLAAMCGVRVSSNDYFINGSGFVQHPTLHIPGKKVICLQTVFGLIATNYYN